MILSDEKGKTMDRLVFMGTPQFAVPALQALASQYSIVGVYTQPDRAVGRGLQLNPSAVKVAALNLGLPVFQPEKLSNPGEYEKLEALRPSVIVVAAYGQILRKNVLNLPAFGCVNIHSSLLPRWRGAAPIQWSILSGDVESGVTTMKMAEGLDTGDILLQCATALSPNETASTLHDRLSVMGADLIVKTLQGLASKTLHGVPQNSEHVTYAHKLSKEMGFLNYNESAVSLDRRIRALTPWPGTTVEVSEFGKLKILEAEPREKMRGLEPGLITDQNGMLVLSTASGCLELKKIQWVSKSPMNPMEFFNGLKGRGQRLPLKILKSS